MPKMGDAMEEGTLVSWHKQDGETVAVGDVIAEIETDKSNVEIEAEDAGVLHTQAQPGAVVAVGKVIAIIGDSVRTAANGSASNGNGSNGSAAKSAGNGTNGAQPQAAGHLAKDPQSVHIGESTQFRVDNSHEPTGQTENMTYADAIRLALQEEMDRDEKVFMLGEEICQYQGTFKITKDFLQKYGP